MFEKRRTDTPPEPPPGTGSARLRITNRFASVPRDVPDDRRHVTQALDLVVDQDNMLWAAFGCWRSGTHRSWVQNALNTVFDYGLDSAGHETAGVGMAVGGAGVLVPFESGDGVSGGVRLAAGGRVVVDDRNEPYTHWFQAVSADSDNALVAATRRNKSVNKPEDLVIDLWAGPNDRVDGWRRLTPDGDTGYHGLAHRQIWVGRRNEHLVCCTSYRDAGITPFILKIKPGSWSVKSLVPSPSELPEGATGISTLEDPLGYAADSPWVLAGTYSNTLPWRGGTGAHIGILHLTSGKTAKWVPLNGSDVVDILYLPGNYVAVSTTAPVNSGNEVAGRAQVHLIKLKDGGLTPVSSVDLDENWCAGGLAQWNGRIYCTAAPGVFDPAPGVVNPLRNRLDSLNLVTTYELSWLG